MIINVIYHIINSVKQFYSNKNKIDNNNNKDIYIYIYIYIC